MDNKYITDFVYHDDDFSTNLLSSVNIEDNCELYKKFIKRFLTYIPVDFRLGETKLISKELVDISFNFIKERKSNNNKLYVFSKNHEKDQQPYIALLILCNHTSLLVNSIYNLISRLSLDLLLLLHPVLYSIRDKDGCIQDIILDINSDLENITKECFIFVKISGEFSEDKLSILENDVNKLLNLVDNTYNAWAPLLKKLSYIQNQLLIHTPQKNDISQSLKDSLSFLNWIAHEHFMLIGIVEFQLIPNTSIIDNLGVKEIWQDYYEEIIRIIKLSPNVENYPNEILTGKIGIKSPVHRSAFLDFILVKTIDDNGVYNAGYIVLGLYGSAMYFNSVMDVPILRSNTEYVLDHSGFPRNGYNAKKMKNIISSLPRDELIQLNKDKLSYICLYILSSIHNNLGKLFIYEDWSLSFVSIMIFLNKKDFTADVHNNISKYFSEQFGSNIFFDHTNVISENIIHLFAKIPKSLVTAPQKSCNEMEQDVISMVVNWHDNVRNKICEEYGNYKGEGLFQEIKSIFPGDYRLKFSGSSVVEDIQYLLKASELKKVQFNLLSISSKEFILKIYKPYTDISLSEILPIIESIGFYAKDGQNFSIQPAKSLHKSWIYIFSLTTQNVEITLDSKLLKNNLEIALGKMLEHNFHINQLSKLLLFAGLTWNKLLLLSALTKYLHQTNFQYSTSYVECVMVRHHTFSLMLVELFEVRFYKNSPLKLSYSEIKKQILLYLDKVIKISEDQVLRSMYLLIESMNRTNYYQKYFNSDHVDDYISFKFDSRAVPNLPLPLPHAEIFVYSTQFEAIHLRGNKIARGGIRWSNRIEDYRTEVLGLMKSQVTKNSIIVPSGAKGAFYVKFDEESFNSKEDYLKQVIECYKNFLRGLLDITDNIVDSKITLCDTNSIVYDELDPYLVVAADKGTSSFSDYANSVSQDYNFWLKDAFASGGSFGYDHKKMGITAKGAWVSLNHHLNNINLDIENDIISFIGIGDMSGDVFGNGMLLSKNIKLVAVFNHTHILIDPNPDLIASYNERKRLFDLTRSNWDDYDKKALSAGGQIYNRLDKALVLSKEIKQLLGVQEVDFLTADEMIKKIMKLDVDVIWNGGIGTFVKSSIENNIDVADKTNDNIRCNAKDLRAKIFIEAGNLGVSQLGRIEYAMNSGMINTDFIDNSAGVDCSDREVNIKILLNNALDKGKISLTKRNQILMNMSTQLEKFILRDNYDQNQSLTITEFSYSLNIGLFSYLIFELEKNKLLNSKLEFLPDRQELEKRNTNREKITRPELAILLSYSKIYLKSLLADSDLIDDKYFQNYLYQYFPEVIVRDFYEEVNSHPLRREIIITIIANNIVNKLGGTIIVAIQYETGCKICDVVRAYFIICELFDIDHLWQSVSQLDSKYWMKIKNMIFTKIVQLVKIGINWIVTNVKHPLDISSTIRQYSSVCKELLTDSGGILTKSKMQYYRKVIEQYTTQKIPQILAEKLVTLELLKSILDISYVANTVSGDIAKIAEVYFFVGENLKIEWLRDKLLEIKTDISYWSKISIQSLCEDFYSQQRRIVDHLIKNSVLLHGNFDVSSWMDSHRSMLGVFFDFIEEIKLQDINIGMLMLANKKLEMFLHKMQQ